MAGVICMTHTTYSVNPLPHVTPPMQSSLPGPKTKTICTANCRHRNPKYLMPALNGSIEKKRKNESNRATSIPLRDPVSCALASLFLSEKPRARRVDITISAWLSPRREHEFPAITCPLHNSRCRFFNLLFPPLLRHIRGRASSTRGDDSYKYGNLVYKLSRKNFYPSIVYTIVCEKFKSNIISIESVKWNLYEFFMDISYILGV